MVSLAMNSYLFDVFILEAIPSLAAGILFGRCATPAGDSRCSTAIRARDWFDGAKGAGDTQARRVDHRLTSSPSILQSAGTHLGTLSVTVVEPAVVRLHVRRRDSPPS